MRQSATPRAGSPAREKLCRVLALLALAACSRQEVDLVGRACPDGTCADGYVCVSGTCCLDGDPQCVITDTDPPPPTCVPNGAERCNGIDDDCDGRIDNGNDLPECTTYYVDADRDSYGTATVAACHCGPPADGESTNDDDCNDGDDDVNPGAVEIVDGIDNNCDGKIDPCFIDCDCGAALLACFTLDAKPPVDDGPFGINGVTVPESADMVRPGLIGNAYLISSSTKSGAFNDVRLFDADDASVLAWVNLTSLNGNYATIRYIVDVQNAQTLSFRGDGRLRCGMQTNIIETASGVLTAGSWNHVACTYGSNSITIYVNGAAVASQSIVPVPPLNEGPFCFGERHNGASDCDSGSAMDGLLDHIQLFRERLSSERVCYASGSPDCLGD